MKKNAYYYEIPRGADFTARVLSCTEAEKAPEGLSHSGKLYCVTLDLEGFYPEGGGQPCDRGWIGTEPLLSVQEQEPAAAYSRGARQETAVSETEQPPILHYLAEPLPVGECFLCRIDWVWRDRNSQNHSGEHIISGLIHRRFGFHNVGFHMAMTLPEEVGSAIPAERPGMCIDFDGELSWEMLLEIEREANHIVREDRVLRCFYPSEAELSALSYRSKRALSGSVRLVEIPGADLCACCGTHVRTTGEIGMIKLLSVLRHRGGSRVALCCGDLALWDYEETRDAASAAAQRLSVPVSGLPEAVERQQAELARRELRIGELNEKYFRLKAERFRGSSRICDFETGLNNVELRKYCDFLLRHSGAQLVSVFLPKTREKTGGETEYSYVIGSSVIDLREGGKRLNSLRCGRGGGAPSMLQGTLFGTEEEIRASVKEAFSE